MLRGGKRAVLELELQDGPIIVERKEGVCASIDLFSNQAWKKHIAAPSTLWISKKLPQKDARRVRGSLVKEQEEIYNTIRDKTIKSKRTTVYDA